MSNINALIRTVDDFKNLARYAELFPNNASSAPLIRGGDWFYQHFAHPSVPFLAVLFYLVLSKPLFNFIRTTFNVQPKGAVLQTITIVHSAFLAVYSGWTCYNTAKIGIPLILEHGLYPTFCDLSGKVWFEDGLGFWVTHFYISKFYEFIDSWIIVLKGRTPIFLQTYHHAGIVLLMWGFVVTGNTAGGLVVTLLNSFIHTLMYTYYTLAAFGYSSPLKAYLTQAQITQFIVGISLTVPTYFIDQCISPAQGIALFGIHLYTLILIYLFVDFYRKSYKKSGSKGKDASQKKQE